MIISSICKGIYPINRLRISIIKLLLNSWSDKVLSHHLLIHIWVFIYRCYICNFILKTNWMLNHWLLLCKVVIRRPIVVNIWILLIYFIWILHENMIIFMSLVLKYVVVSILSRSLYSCIVPNFIFIISKSLTKVLISVEWINIILHFNPLLLFCCFLPLFDIYFILLYFNSISNDFPKVLIKIWFLQLLQ